MPPRTPGYGGVTPAAPTPASRFSRKKDVSTDTSGSSSGGGSDEVSVFCRLRPLQQQQENHPEYVASVQNVENRAVRLIPPESSRAYNSGKQMEYGFKRVFDGESETKEVN